MNAANGPPRPAQSAAPRARREVSMAGSSGLWEWLNAQRISLAFTTYQSNRLFLLGCKEGGLLAVNERLFDKPMGLFYCAASSGGESLTMSCRYQIWQLDNRLAPGSNITAATAFMCRASPTPPAI